MVTTPPRTTTTRLGLRIIEALAFTGLAALAGAASLAWYSSRRVEKTSKGRIFELSDVPEMPIAMVLGARAYPNRPSSFLAARLDLAVSLWRAEKIKAVLVSGDGLARSNHETRVMRDYLVEHGIPKERIVEDPAGFDTYDSCARAKRVYGVRQMIIVSQGYHLPRAITLSGALGIDAVGVGDASVKDLFPQKHAQGELRESFANFKMEWDLLIKRLPQQDPFDGSLLAAASSRSGRAG